jgi:predicted dehydrogenase
MEPVVELFGYWANVNHPTIEVEDTTVAVLRFANRALGSIVARNSEKLGLFGRIHIHGTTGASVGVQVESGSAFTSGVTNEAAPPINDIWAIPGQEHLLPIWQREDTDRAATLDIMQDYHRRQIEDYLVAVTENRAPAVSGGDASPWSSSRRSTDPTGMALRSEFLWHPSPCMSRTLGPAPCVRRRET